MLKLWFDPTFTVPRSAYLTLRPIKDWRAHLALMEAAQQAADDRRRIAEWVKASA